MKPTEQCALDVTSVCAGKSPASYFGNGPQVRPPNSGAMFLRMFCCEGEGAPPLPTNAHPRSPGGRTGALCKLTPTAALQGPSVAPEPSGSLLFGHEIRDTNEAIDKVALNSRIHRGTFPAPRASPASQTSGSPRRAVSRGCGEDPGCVAHREKARVPLEKIF